MSDVQERLERLRNAGRLSRKPAPAPAPPPAPPPASAVSVEDLSDLPGMEVMHSERGSFLLRTTRFDLTHRQGVTRLGDLLELPPGVGASAVAEPALAELDFRRAVFIDTETSGLAGGAGTIVFLTGVGTFEDGQYVVRQYFARTPGEEPAYLPALAEQLAGTAGLVSFNGRSFDLPLLRTRFVLAGLHAPTEHLPHLDLLHPARRLWRARLGACNFGHLETQILGYRRAAADVPSWMIPGMWFEFARGGGNIGDMAGVLYHNLEDVVSMAPLAHMVCGTFAGIVSPHPGDMLALAAGYERRGLLPEAEDAYRRALTLESSAEGQAAAMTGLATVLKRQERREEAAQWWERLAELALPASVDPHIELAKYHEWATGDAAQALAWTLAALRQVEAWPAGYDRVQTLHELQHRRTRLQQKLESGVASRKSRVER